MTLGVVPLQEFCRIVQGGRLGLSGNDFVPDGCPAYGAGGLNGRLSVCEFEEPAVILSAIGARCGKCFYATGKWTSLANTQLIFPDPRRADCRFLWFQLNDERRWHRSGTGQPFIKPSDVKAHRVFLPPLAEQRRIADVLDKAEALRAKRRAALAQLDELTQSVFIDMFGDPLVNPLGWDLKRLDAIGTIERGVSKHRPRNAPGLLGGPYPFVQTGDVANSGGYICSFSSTYSEAGLRQSQMWSAGTLCITIAANIAKTGILTFDACFPDSVVGFLPNEASTTEFVQHWLSFLQASLEESAPESAQKNINLATLRNLRVPVPPIALQREFTRRVSAVEKVKATQRASLSELDALFGSLQHRAFRGEL